MRTIANFGIYTSENFTMSLLLNRQDKIACDKKYLKVFSHDLTEELLVFAIRNLNEQFLAYSLSNTLLSSDFVNEKIVRDEILSQLEFKARDTFILNVLLFADFSRWPQTDLQKFLDCIDSMNEESHMTNRIVLRANPILAICLACIHLTSIGNSISLFKHRGATIS